MYGWTGRSFGAIYRGWGASRVVLSRGALTLGVGIASVVRVVFVVCGVLVCVEAVGVQIKTC